MEYLGEDVKEFKDEFKDFTLDLLPKLKAPLKFMLCYEKREIVNFNGIDIAFISLENLIQDKKATSRPKDLSDIEQLKNKNDEGNKLT